MTAQVICLGTTETASSGNASAAWYAALISRMSAGLVVVPDVMAVAQRAYRTNGSVYVSNASPVETPRRLALELVLKPRILRDRSCKITGSVRHVPLQSFLRPSRFHFSTCRTNLKDTHSTWTSSYFTGRNGLGL